MAEKIAIIYGTRPEFLKVFPLIHHFKKNHEEICIINTGQHDSMLTQMEHSFGILPNFSLTVQNKEYSNSNLIAKLINELSSVVIKENISKIFLSSHHLTK